MSEFNSRMATQRKILQLVNTKKWETEDLFGLSSKAIERWISANRLDPQSKLIKLVMTASSQLFFLANKSQEQLSDEYASASDQIRVIAQEIETELGMTIT